MAKIIKFPGLTTSDIDVDGMLEKAKGELDGVVIAGVDKEGHYYFASSFGDSAETLWLIEKFKHELFVDDEFDE